MKNINYTKIQKDLDENGYVVLENFLSKPYCKKYLSKILSMNKKQYDHIADKKKDASSYVVWNLQNKDKLFLDLIFNKKINKICENFFSLGTYKNEKDSYQFELLHARVLKQNAVSQNLHLDSRTCAIHPPTALQFNFYLDNLNLDDGPLQLVPKSHKIKRHPTIKDNKKAKKILAKAGSVIIHNSNTWHGSAEKKSKKYRVNLLLAFNRWYLKQQFAVPYGLPLKFQKKLTIKQKKILGYFNYPPQTEATRMKMSGPLTNYLIK